MQSYMLYLGFSFSFSSRNAIKYYTLGMFVTLLNDGNLIIIVHTIDGTVDKESHIYAIKIAYDDLPS